LNREVPTVEFHHGQKKDTAIPILRVKKGDDLKAIYAKARTAFTAADLQKYTEIEEGIPMQQIIAQLEAIQHEEARKRKKKKG
jgi:hypothetical protein